jgi:hypothetical protein
VGESADRRRLEAVLAEQARRSDDFHRAIGTGGETSAYFRLRNVNEQVAKYDRIVRGLADVRPRAPHL